MSKKKILLVDDSKVTRRSISILLEKHDFESVTLDNAEDLVTFADRYTDVSLILLDINLPGMDGLTALGYINQLSTISHIPVIMITGDSDMEIVKKAASLNVVDYVLKPYIPSKLLARIERALNPQEVDTETATTPSPENVENTEE